MRTPTDNSTAAMTCAVRRLARWPPCPIWLCKQGSRVHGRCSARLADLVLVDDMSDGLISKEAIVVRVQFLEQATAPSFDPSTHLFFEPG